MIKTKRLRAEKREEQQKKLKEKRASLADQIKRMRTSKDYAGDAKKF